MNELLHGEGSSPKTGVHDDALSKAEDMFKNLGDSLSHPSSLIDGILDSAKQAYESGSKSVGEWFKKPHGNGMWEPLPELDLKGFGKFEGVKDPIHEAATSKVERSMNGEQMRQLEKEREEYHSKFQKWSVLAAVGINPPEPGPMMKEYDRRVQKEITDARSRVDKSMNGEDMHKLLDEQKDYSDRLRARSIQIGIGISWPEPGPRMKKYEQDVVNEISKS